jgi:hypothetical protein
MSRELIKGVSPDEKFQHLEIILDRMRRLHGIGRNFVPTQCTTISGFSDGTELRQFIGFNGKLNSLELYIDDIEVDENKKKNAGMQLQFLRADFKGVSYSYLARVGRNSFKLDLPIVVGTKIRMTFDRRVVGVWYAFVLTPFITKSQVIDMSEEPEVVDEGVQLPLARGIV